MFLPSNVLTHIGNRDTHAIPMLPQHWTTATLNNEQAQTTTAAGPK